MFCDACGAAVYPGQSFCSRCGKQIVGTIAAVPSGRGRVAEHVRLLGILWLAFSAMNALAGVVLFIVANTLFVTGSGVKVPGFLHPMLSVLAVLILAKGGFGFLTGWGLLHREAWARVAALVLAFISLFSVPFGTAIGVYTLWVLLPGDSEQEYENLSAHSAAA